MSDLNDAIDAYRRTVLRRSDAPDGTSLDATAIWERLEARRRRRHLRTMSLVVVLALFVPTAAVGIYRATVARPDVVVCFADTDAESSRIVPTRNLSDPVAACADLWESDMVPHTTLSPGEVPALTVCVGPDGAAWVFPGDAATCGLLGLPDRDPAPTSNIAPLDQLVERLDERTPRDPCIAPDHAVPIVEDTLDELGMDTWTVRIRTTGPRLPCTSYAIDPDQHVVEIIPIP